MIGDRDHRDHEDAQEHPAPLPLLKVLADDTRYAIYRDLVHSPRPRSTSEISASVGLHPNTVRPHLERMRRAGLIEVSVDAVISGRRRVGRPEHRYAVTASAPSLGLDPPGAPTLIGMVLALADRLGASAVDAEAIGRDEGRRRSVPFASGRPIMPTCDALIADHDVLGFAPAVRGSGETSETGETVTFGRCPFGASAGLHPELVCGLHRGLIDGFVDALGGAELGEFHPLSDRAPCRATLR